MKKNKYKKSKVLLGTLAGAGLSYWIIGNAFYERILSRHFVNKNNAIPEVDNTFLDEIKNKKVFKNGSEWFLAHMPEDTEIVSLRGDTIHANIIEAKKPSDVYAVCTHGYTSSPYGMAMFGYEFHKMGYNVLFPYLRGHSKSESDYVSMGYYDHLDIIDWISYIVSTNSNAKIILFGVSMGAATIMMATGTKLPDNVKCAIEDCGYTSVWEEFIVQAKAIFHLPPFPLLYAANTVAKIRGGLDFKKTAPVEYVRKSKTPTLFIHGDKDKFVPFWMLDILYDNASCEKEKLVVPGAEHAVSAQINPDLYWSTVKKFVNKYID